MRFLIVMALPMFLTACCDAAPPPKRVSEESKPFRPLSPAFAPGEVLVKFKTGVRPEQIAAILRETKTELIAELKGIQVYHVRIVGGESVESVVKKLSSMKEVEYAEPNYLRQPETQPVPGHK